MSRESLLRQLAEDDAEDGTTPMPAGPTLHPKAQKPATLDDIARQLAALNAAAAAAAEASRPKLVRSRLSVAEKVKLIAELGESGYLALPYE